MRNQLVIGLLLVAGLPVVSFGDIWIRGEIGFYPGNYYQYDVPFYGSRNQYIPPAVYGPFYGPGYGYHPRQQFAPAPFPAYPNPRFNNNDYYRDLQRQRERFERQQRREFREFQEELEDRRRRAEREYRRWRRRLD